MAHNRGETVVAVASPPGKGAVATIRISGPQAREFVLQKLRCRKTRSFPARRPVLAHFLGLDKRPIDQVLVTVFPEPASYTGEELVEISCHGSVAVTRRIVEEILGLGARLAEPGEFTLRAFLNGKMDLAQAEAVRDLIESQTSFQAKVATQQLEGRLSGRLKPVKDEIVRILCHVETAVEFVEEEVEPEARDTLLRSLESVDEELDNLEASFPLGRIVHEGITVVIAGKPNSGKSSVFNSLVKDNRAIVTDIPGTTRDAVTETISLQGIPTRLVDTAGIRRAADPVEHLGIRKSMEFLSECAVVLFVVDSATEFGEADCHIWKLICNKTCVLVVNKEDLVRHLEIPPEVAQACAATVQISALQGTHLEELRASVVRLILPEEGLAEETVLVTDIRHKRCIESARGHLRTGIEAYRAGMSEEFPLYDFRKALEALGQITGETTVEDLLTQIFSTFCIGK